MLALLKPVLIFVPCAHCGTPVRELRIAIPDTAILCPSCATGVPMNRPRSPHLPPMAQPKAIGALPA